jgi:hypothetical protein
MTHRPASASETTARTTPRRDRPQGSEPEHARERRDGHPAECEADEDDVEGDVETPGGTARADGTHPRDDVAVQRCRA